MAGKPRSLIELKQQQWARERAEELKNYNGIWGRYSDAAEPRYRPCIRGINRSTTDLESLPNGTPPVARKRTPSLPPLHSNNYEVQSPPGDDSGGGDTSGYASDSADFAMTENLWKPINWQQQAVQGPRRTPESFSSGSGGGREERAKWGERGVGVGHLWSPSVHMPANLLPQIEPTAPTWIQRGLQEPAQVLVISHDESLPGSLANSHDMSKSTDTLISEEYQRCFLRGMNTPIDPQLALEKERKRQKALEHQNAIKQQLEEKEQKKRAEQERQKIEEIMEEQRLKRHHELEIQRLEDEKRRQIEKEEKDERVAKALREAIEIAEKKAKEEKARARRKHIAARRSPTPSPRHRPTANKLVDPGLGVVSRRAPMEGINRLDDSATSCKKSDILVYHSEVLIHTPSPLGVEDASPTSHISATPQLSHEEPALKVKSVHPGSGQRERRSPKSRRSPDIHRPSRDIRQPSPDIEIHREEPSPRQESKASERFISSEKLDYTDEPVATQEDGLQLIPERLVDNEVAGSAGDKDDEGDHSEAIKHQNSTSEERTNGSVDRAVSPMNPPSTGSLSLLSTSPSQDPPPPPGNQPGGKEPPSDAVIPAESSQMLPPIADPQSHPETSELEEILTVAVQDISIDEREIESSRLWIIPSPTPGRLLTPTSQRCGRRRMEVATQTETRVSRATRRVQRLEDRPKWGVNRPPMRYIKASDRYPFSRTRNDTDDSRSPSPMNKSSTYSNFLPRRMRNSSTDSSKTQKESKAINTPRTVHILPKPGIMRRNSAGRRYISLKGPKLLSRPSASSPNPKKFDMTELLTVKDVLSQLSSLKYGLKIKQKEWDVSRSSTPFSEVSSVS